MVIPVFNVDLTLITTTQADRESKMLLDNLIWDKSHRNVSFSLLLAYETRIGLVSQALESLDYPSRSNLDVASSREQG